MKVLMFGWEFPPLITGGLGTACQGLSQELSTLVEKVTFVLPQRDRKSPSLLNSNLELLDGNELLQRTSPVAKKTAPPLDSSIYSSLEYYSVASALAPYLSEVEYQRQMALISKERSLNSRHQDQEIQHDALFLNGGYGADLFKEVVRFARVSARAVQLDQYNIIHAHDWMTFLAGVEAKNISGKPLIVHVHSLEFDRCGDNINQQVYDLERYGLENADRIIAVSHRTKEMIVSRYGIDPHKIRVIHNGVNPVEHHDVRAKWFDGPLVIFMGRITMQKGPEYFLNAAYLVSQKIPNVQFVMAGSGDMRNRMILRMAELGLVDRFHFPGFLDQTRRAQLLSMADVFVLSSVSEPFGLTPMEALQFGVPVVVSKQSGVAEILTHAIKVDFWDARKMSDAIIKILSEPSLAHQLGQGGQRELSHVNWHKPALQMKQLYEEIIS